MPVEAGKGHRFPGEALHVDNVPPRCYKNLTTSFLTKRGSCAMVNPMVKYHRLDATFHALADPTRRAILAALKRGQRPVSVLAAPHRMSLPAVMKHLQVLEHAGLVRQKKSGRVRQCHLSAKPLKQA